MTKRPSSAKQARLQVFLDRDTKANPMLIGECLWVASSGTAAFEWSDAATASAVDLSPLMLPNARGVFRAQQAPFAGIHPLFSDSIPDGFGLRLMNKGLQAAGFDLEQINPLHRLAWVGARGVGALTYQPAIDAQADGMLTSLVDAAKLAAKAEAESFQDIPQQALRAGGSAQGARPKFWAAIGPDNTKIILGDLPQAPLGFTPCLLKFAPSTGDRNEPFFEAACLELANLHGIQAARGQLLTHANAAALAVERFDRLASGERIHTQSVAALLGISFREPSLDYTALAKLARRLGGDADVQRLYRQLCFNVALSMRDDHAKNFAFCQQASGQWTLSPAFDLCPSTGNGYTGEHTTTINGKGANITRGDLEAFARSQGLSQQLAHEGIDQAREAAAGFEALAVSLGATKTGAQRWSKIFKDIDKDLQPMQSSGAPPTPANRSA